jgi:hypothetical protein
VRTLRSPRDKAEIVRRLGNVGPRSARRWGRMSAHQMVCHLSDSFLCCLGDKPVSHDAGLLQRTIVKWLALYVPLRWPRGIRTRPEIDQEQGGTRPGQFAADVAELLRLLELVTGDAKGFAWQSHPRFGAMSDADWMRWGYLHMDHHLRQFGA